MSTKSSVQFQQSLKPDFIVGELYISAESSMIVLVTGEGLSPGQFAGTILHKGGSGVFSIGENNQHFSKAGFMPFKGSVTLEAE